MKKMILLLFLFLWGAVSGEEKNLIPNADFRFLVKGKPEFWHPAGTTARSQWFFRDRSGKGVIRFEKNGMLRQYSSMRLKHGEKYRMTAKVRFINTAPGGRADIMLINEGWKKSSGLHNIRPSEKWRTIGCDFLLPASANGTKSSRVQR